MRRAIEDNTEISGLISLRLDKAEQEDLESNLACTVISFLKKTLKDGAVEQ